MAAVENFEKEAHAVCVTLGDPSTVTDSSAAATGYFIVLYIPYSMIVLNASILKEFTKDETESMQFSVCCKFAMGLIILHILI